MRNRLELLKLLLTQVEDCEPILFFGICAEISTMNGSFTGVVPGCEITKDESELLRVEINKHKPNHLEDYEYWWVSGDKKPRIDFLNELIKNTQNG